MVHAGGEGLEVLGRGGGDVDVGVIVLVQEAGGVLVWGLTSLWSRESVFGTQGAGFVGVGAPSVGRFVVDGDGRFRGRAHAPGGRRPDDR